MEPIDWARAAGFAFGGAMFWIAYFDLKDRLRPEPRRTLVLAFALGGVAAGIALAVYRLGEAAGVPEVPGLAPAAVAAWCMLWVGPVEEGAKFAVVRGAIFGRREFDEIIDGPVYAAVSAVGFAAVENLLYAPHVDWRTHLARSIASPLTHSMFAAVWGYGLARARLAAPTRAGAIAWQAGTLAAAIVLHGAYDAILLSTARPWLAAVLVAALWLAFLVQARRAVRVAYPSPRPAR